MAFTFNDATAPIKQIYEELIDHIDDDKFDELYSLYLPTLEKFEDNEYFMSHVAMQAIKNPPNEMEYKGALKNIKKKYKDKTSELLMYKRNTKAIIDYVEELSLWCFAWRWLAEQYERTEENNNKRWSKKEDECLIDMACKEYPLVWMSAALHRTPSSVSARLTNLVGVKQKLQKIAGKFIGTADGKEAEMDLVGTLYKEG